jgi:hypothetical protein
VDGDFGTEFGGPVLNYVDLGGDDAWIEDGYQEAMPISSNTALFTVVNGAVGDANTDLRAVGRVGFDGEMAAEETEALLHTD